MTALVSVCVGSRSTTRPAGSTDTVIPSLVALRIQRRSSAARIRTIDKCCSRAAVSPK